MKKQTLEVFHSLMKKGWIDRTENAEIWRLYNDPDVLSELETMGDVLGFVIFPSIDRIYLVPSQDNDLFLKSNADFRRDISADSDVKTRDLYLMNYLSIYILFVFYGGSGSDPKCRDFISKEDALKAFSDHCRNCIKGAQTAGQTDYSENFIQLANSWLSKIDGTPDSRKFAERYGVLNRLLVKFNSEHDDLFYVESDIIRPTRKLDDLMPYFLRKERISDMNLWLNNVDTAGATEETDNASDN